MQTTTHTSLEEHQVQAKAAEAQIRTLVDTIVQSNDDQVAIGALDILHKLISK